MEEKDILVSKRKYWTKLMKYNLVGTVFLVIYIFIIIYGVQGRCLADNPGVACGFFMILYTLWLFFLLGSWPLSFVMYGYQSLKIQKINTNESLEQRQRQHEAQLEHIVNKKIETKKKQAMKREEALDYDSAIEIWESLGEIKEAARVRKLKTEQGAVKVTQKVVHGDEVTKTEIKDSVLNRSNIGAGSDDKLTKIKELKELHDAGAIDDDEFKQMKKEILGK